MPDYLLTVQETADLFHVSVRTVYRMIRSGQLDAINVGTPGRTIYRLSAAQVHDVLAGRRPLGGLLLGA